MSIGEYHSTNLSVDPYEGIGPFKIGQSLNQTINHALKCKLKFKIVSNLENPNDSPIVLIIEDYGLKIYFNSSDQVLVYIQVYKFNKVLFNRHGDLLNADYNPPNFQKIYTKIFGPTYTGDLDENDFYHLSYEGIGFEFNLKDYTNSSKKLVQFINDHSQQIFCHSFVLFKLLSLSEFQDDAKMLLKQPHLPLIKLIRSGLFDHLTIDNKAGCIKFHTTQRRGKAHQIGHDEEYFNVEIGSTTFYDILAQFGNPDDTFMSSCTSLKYHNYFQYGCDFCYDISTPNMVLKKVIIHNNLINSFEFMKYERLNWVLELPNSGYGHNSRRPLPQFSNLHDFQDLMPCLDSKKLSQPIFLNRNEYDLVNSLSKKLESFGFNDKNEQQRHRQLQDSLRQNFELIDYEDDFDELGDDHSDTTINEVEATNDKSKKTLKHDLSSETLAKNNFETTTNSRDRSKDWGLTNLYCYENLVFEVLIDNGKISMVTMC